MVDKHTKVKEEGDNHGSLGNKTKGELGGLVDSLVILVILNNFTRLLVTERLILRNQNSVALSLGREVTVDVKQGGDGNSSGHTDDRSQSEHESHHDTGKV